MQIDDNKALVLQWVSHWNENDHLALAALYSDEEFSWRISGLSPVSHRYCKADIVALMAKTFATPMKQKLHLTIKQMTAEEDRVSLEAEGFGIYADGSEFRNFYHLLFTIRDRKVIRGRAYLDTWLAVNSSLQKSIDHKG